MIIPSQGGNQMEYKNIVHEMCPHCGYESENKVPYENTPSTVKCSNCGISIALCSNCTAEGCHHCKNGSHFELYMD